MLLKVALFVVFFMVIIEFFTILFRINGIPESKARFQVISLITGSGYTTKESEMITKNNQTRKIAKMLMIIGYLGLATVISLLAEFVHNFLTLKSGVILLMLLTLFLWLLKNKHFLIYFKLLLEKSHVKKMRKNNYRNIFTLLDKSNGYGLYHIIIQSDNQFIGKTLKESRLKQSKIQILNIDKGDEFIAFPSADYVIEVEDKLLVYGDIKNIKKIFFSKKTKKEE